MSQKARRYSMREKEAKALLTEASQKIDSVIGRIVSDKDRFEVIETDFGKIFLVNRVPILAKTDELFPLLSSSQLLDHLPKIIVDMGAVPHICNGAGLMAPGIRGFEGDFTEGAVVVILDERHHKALAVARTCYGSEKMKTMKQGVVARNIHFVNDKVWKVVRNLATD